MREVEAFEALPGVIESLHESLISNSFGLRSLSNDDLMWKTEGVESEPYSRVCGELRMRSDRYFRR
jgi:hypothetical protein